MTVLRLLVALLLAGCGSSEPSRTDHTAPPSTTATPTNSCQALATEADCCARLDQNCAWLDPDEGFPGGCVQGSECYEDTECRSGQTCLSVEAPTGQGTCKPSGQGDLTFFGVCWPR